MSYREGIPWYGLFRRTSDCDGLVVARSRRALSALFSGRELTASMRGDLAASKYGEPTVFPELAELVLSPGLTASEAKSEFKERSLFESPRLEDEPNPPPWLGAFPVESPPCI